MRLAVSFVAPASRRQFFAFIFPNPASETLALQTIAHQIKLISLN
jgi:hypothetical protein